RLDQLVAWITWDPALVVSPPLPCLVGGHPIHLSSRRHRIEARHLPINVGGQADTDQCDKQAKRNQRAASRPGTYNGGITVVPLLESAQIAHRRHDDRPAALAMNLLPGLSRLHRELAATFTRKQIFDRHGDSRFLLRLFAAENTLAPPGERNSAVDQQTTPGDIVARGIAKEQHRSRYLVRPA